MTPIPTIEVVTTKGLGRLPYGTGALVANATGALRSPPIRVTVTYRGVEHG